RGEGGGCAAPGKAIEGKRDDDVPTIPLETNNGDHGEDTFADEVEDTVLASPPRVAPRKINKAAGNKVWRQLEKQADLSESERGQLAAIAYGYLESEKFEPEYHWDNRLRFAVSKAVSLHRNRIQREKRKKERDAFYQKVEKYTEQSKK